LFGSISLFFNSKSRKISRKSSMCLSLNLDITEEPSRMWIIHYVLFFIFEWYNDVANFNKLHVLWGIVRNSVVCPTFILLYISWKYLFVFSFFYDIHQLGEMM
jgi:hypothetical protein